MSRLRRTVVALVASSASFATLASPALAAAPVGPRPFRPPVSAPMTRPFEAPNGPYGAGHRGLDYGVRPGEVVSAVGDGTVVFVGRVAGNVYVTVLHPNGLRSTSSYVRDPLVRRGQRVRLGAPLARTSERFMLSIRLGDTYLDPALLIGGGGRPRHARLVRHRRSP